MDVLASWITALSTFGALVAAVVAAITAKRLYDVERERDEERRTEKRRIDASAVVAWTAVHFDEDDKRTNGLIVRNSRAPIYDIVVESQDWDGSSQPALKLSSLPPGVYFVGRGDQYPWTFPDEVSALGGMVRPVAKKPEWCDEIRLHRWDWCELDARCAGTPVRGGSLTSVSTVDENAATHGPLTCQTAFHGAYRRARGGVRTAGRATAARRSLAAGR